MRIRTLLFAALAAAAMLASACADIQPPFGRPEDHAMNRQVIDAIGDYAQTVNTTTVGGRVYLEGQVPNFEERQDVVARVRDVPGVREIVDNLELTEVGSNSDNPSQWD